MVEFLETLIKQGGLGIVAAVFLWLYLREAARHDVTRTEKDTMAEARRLHAIETRAKGTATLEII